VLTAVLGALLIAASSLFVASPAQAHDELLSSDPAAGSTADALPAQVTLTFSGMLSTSGSEVAVTDAAGTSLVDGAPVVADTVLTQPLAGEASGVVTVVWRVVSSDAHPISGEFSFTVTAAAPVTPEPTASPTASPSEVPADEGSSLSDAWPWVVGGLLLAAILGAVIYLLTSRARRDRALSQRPGEGSGPAA
jgi:methionine-rich copper-binding protein CopC